jgi:two-component system, chemotaxis family, protein-glutamate methylesterase/glutaminase
VIRTLLVDDSAVIRRMFSRVLVAQNDIQVVGEAPDPYVARDLIVEKKPDVVVLDIEMPRMDGLTFLRRLMKHHPMPVVVCSTLTVRGGETAMEAMDAGAVGVVCKPTETHSLAEMAPELVAAVRSAAGAKPRGRLAAAARQEASLRAPSRSLLAIGASTGGTVAIETILRSLPENAPPIVIVQHMPAYMTPLFADRLDKVSRLRAREARDGDALETGLALVAPGGKHLLVEAGPSGFRARVKDGPLVNGHRPAADVLFSSVARAAGKAAIGVLLTGMGKDGARGLLQMRGAGARTIAQDEASSVVYGMPKAAVDIDAAQEVVSLGAIPARLVRLAESMAA